MGFAVPDEWKSQVSNIGPNELRVIDSATDMHVVEPGAVWIGQLRSIYIGEKRTEFSVEPVAK